MLKATDETQADTTPQTAQEMKQDLEAFRSGIPIIIETDQQFSEAEGHFVRLKKKRRFVEGWFKDFLKPVKDAYDIQKAKAQYELGQLDIKANMLGAAMKRWRVAEADKRVKEQAKLNKLHEKRVARAEVSGRDVMEVAPPKVVGSLPKSSDTDAGKAVYATYQEVDIFDEGLIPLDKPAYWKVVRTPIKPAIKADLLAGIKVPGCALRDEERLMVR